MAEENRPMSIEMDGETQMMRPEEIEKMTVFDEIRQHSRYLELTHKAS